MRTHLLSHHAEAGGGLPPGRALVVDELRPDVQLRWHREDLVHTMIRMRTDIDVSSRLPREHSVRREAEAPEVA